VWVVAMSQQTLPIERFWMPNTDGVNLHKDVQMYCQSYDVCPCIGNLSLASLARLVVPPYRLNLS